MRTSPAGLPRKLWEPTLCRRPRKLWEPTPSQRHANCGNHAKATLSQQTPALWDPAPSQSRRKLWEPAAAQLPHNLWEAHRPNYYANCGNPRRPNKHANCGNPRRDSYNEEHMSKRAKSKHTRTQCETHAPQTDLKATRCVNTSPAGQPRKVWEPQHPTPPIKNYPATFHIPL